MWKLKIFFNLKWNLLAITNNGVEEVVRFAAVEVALYVVKEFLLQRPRDDLSRIKMVQTLSEGSCIFSNEGYPYIHYCTVGSDLAINNPKINYGFFGNFDSRISKY